ncbi:ABC transporter permease/substrate-binding protein [Pseudorhodoplanes sinuspersici]|uniref:ABC transporter permease n=1 Tax=Pseudorhodoplanes sinuspersici TaxID=1235591 RepID=A0A1W6ZS47_9HYPH|nr:ABC transporter permease/substrate-binding protein [Pseudorhodoplanes sinuspersici]ARQ00190.1 ABC transporter permease [Pseudorhodoplanes sinuspersici]RKE67674.1 osmoprotectant transport system permease protein [Pseudorhodoplanes sinuspersici]
MSIDPAIADAWSRLPDYLSQHVLVSLTALAIGLAISLPLALFSVRRPYLRDVVLGIASIVQTIPGLALLALFYPLLLGTASLTARFLGFDFSALGFLPSVLALALYSMLPVLRNTITGIEGVDPDLRWAAQGVGMTERQSLFMVELPLAIPVIMAGIRTAAVWVIGTATLSTPIGQTSLGNYIFSGLQTQNWISVLFGCVAAALLAMAVDQLLALMERGAASRRRSPVIAGFIGLFLIVSLALAPAWGARKADYVIGAKTFSEQYILAALMAQSLEAQGLTARRREGLGSNIIFAALVANDIDAYVEYTGTIWATMMKRSDIKSRAETLAEVTQWLEREHGVRLAGALGFENAYALAMKRSEAERLGIRTIADLARVAPNMSIAGDYEFFGRAEWAAIRDGYGLHFREERSMQAEFMYPAVGNEVDVIAAYTSDGRIAQFDLVVLDDPKHVIPPYDAVLLLSPKRAKDTALINALKPLNGAIDVALMREANLRANQGESPDNVARWLWDKLRGK